MSCLPVDPSITTKAGGVTYPWPKDVIPILSNLEKVVISNTCGICTVGAKVESEG